MQVFGGAVFFETMTSNIVHVCEQVATQHLHIHSLLILEPIS